MFSICMRMTGNRADAEDVLQDTFILAFKSLHQLKYPEQFGGWLRRITVNACIRKSKQALNWQDLEDYQHSNTEDGTDWWNSISLELVNNEIKNLPDGCRQVFVLYVLEDLKHQEIAGNLGISESTSKSQYQRAKQLLRERITKQMVSHG